MKTLTQILSAKRPHGGTGEAELLRQCAAFPGAKLLRSPFGDTLAVLVTVGAGRSLFVSHLDTVHRADGPQVVHDRGGVLFKTDNEPLGADDGAGVWLLWQMIRAQVPGGYLFTVGEERGGVGATGVAAHHADMLAQYDRAVSFDRRGVSSVITHQAGGRCCSDTFAQSLADALNEALPDGFMLPDSTGVYTDSAEFTDHIGECTNISVGYDREHSGAETLDTVFLRGLAAACCAIEWDTLPTDRQPGEPDPAGWGYDYRYDEGYATGWTRRRDSLHDRLIQMDIDALTDWVRRTPPDAVAETLADALYEIDAMGAV